MARPTHHRTPIDDKHPWIVNAEGVHVKCGRKLNPNQGTTCWDCFWEWRGVSDGPVGPVKNGDISEGDTVRLGDGIGEERR